MEDIEKASFKIGEEKDEIWCIECNRQFQDKKSIWFHNRTIHNSCPSICDVCSGEFKNKDNLRKHIQRIHGFQETQTCDQCNKVFKAKFNLVMHIRNVHEKEDCFCHKCGKKLKNNIALKKHVKKKCETRSTFPVSYIKGSRKGSESQYCKICDVTFNTRHLLTTHMHNRHLGKLLECKICHLKTSTYSNMSRHFKVKHNITSKALVDATVIKVDGTVIKTHELNEGKKFIGNQIDCSICGKNYSYMRYHHGHRKTCEDLFKKNKELIVQNEDSLLELKRTNNENCVENSRTSITKLRKIKAENEHTNGKFIHKESIFQGIKNSLAKDLGISESMVKDISMKELIQALEVSKTSIKTENSEGSVNEKNKEVFVPDKFEKTNNGVHVEERVVFDNTTDKYQEAKLLENFPKCEDDSISSEPTYKTTKLKADIEYNIQICDVKETEFTNSVELVKTNDFSFKPGDEYATEDQYGTPVTETDMKTSEGRDMGTICTICSKEFGIKSKLKIHKYLWHANGSYLCPVCGKACGLRGTLKNHIYECHKAKKEFFCKLCEESVVNLQKHLKNEHCVGIDPAQSVNCHQCKQSFQTKKYLNAHMKTYHQVPISKHKSTYKCPECDLEFETPKKRSDHKAKHRFENQECNDCHTIFKSLKNLRKHIQMLHEFQEPQTCVQCNKVFKAKVNLNIHIRNVHEKEDCFCHKCGKKMKNSIALKRHICPQNGKLKCQTGNDV